MNLRFGLLPTMKWCRCELFQPIAIWIMACNSPRVASLRTSILRQMGSLEFFNVTLIWYTGVAVFAAEADAGAFLLAAFRAVVFFVFVVFRAGIFFISLKPGANAAEGVE